MSKVPCINRDDLTEEQKTIFFSKKIVLLPSLKSRAGGLVSSYGNYSQKENFIVNG